MELTKLIRKNILDLSPYKSARSEFSGRADIFLDANENPFPSGFNRYPDPLQKKLKSLISKWRNIREENIMLGNGSDEIIDLLVRIFCNPGEDSIYTFKPSFGMFRVVANINDVKYHEYPLDDNFHLDVVGFVENIPASCKIIFLCSPNNPTGNSLTLDQVTYILEHSDQIVVIDEAYIDFSSQSSRIQMITQFKNLVVTQTFSKALGSAGVRIGIAFGNEEVIHYLNCTKMPYNLSLLNQEEGIRVLNQINKYNHQVSTIKNQKIKVRSELEKCSFINKIYPSDANFLLVKTIDGGKLYHYLIDHGVVVRNRSNQYGCEDCLRITIGTEEENNHLLEVLNSYNKV